MLCGNVTITNKILFVSTNYTFRPTCITAALREKRLIMEYFCSAFSCIWTESGDLLCLLRKSPYSLQMWKNADQKIPHLVNFYAVFALNACLNVAPYNWEIQSPEDFL